VWLSDVALPEKHCYSKIWQNLSKAHSQMDWAEPDITIVACGTTSNPRPLRDESLVLAFPDIGWSRSALGRGIENESQKPLLDDDHESKRSHTSTWLGHDVEEDLHDDVHGFGNQRPKREGEQVHGLQQDEQVLHEYLGST